MVVDASQPLRHPEIVALGRSLFERRQEVVEGMVERIRSEIGFYRSGVVAIDDLRASCDRNYEMILWPLINSDPVDLRPPRETGRRRAQQRAPPAGGDGGLPGGIPFRVGGLGGRSAAARAHLE